MSWPARTPLRSERISFPTLSAESCSYSETNIQYATPWEVGRNPLSLRETHAPRAPRCAPRAHRACVSTNPFLHFSHFFRVARTRWPKG